MSWWLGWASDLGLMREAQRQKCLSVCPAWWVTFKELWELTKTNDLPRSDFSSSTQGQRISLYIMSYTLETGSQVASGDTVKTYRATFGRCRGIFCKFLKLGKEKVTLGTIWGLRNRFLRENLNWYWNTEKAEDIFRMDHNPTLTGFSLRIINRTSTTFIAVPMLGSLNMLLT